MTSIHNRRPSATHAFLIPLSLLFIYCTHHFLSDSFPTRMFAHPPSPIEVKLLMTWILFA